MATPHILKLAHQPKKRLARHRLTFSIQSLRAIAPPAAGRLEVYDTRQPGLAVRITAQDARSFYFVKFLAGRTIRVKLGDVGVITVEQARRQAAKLAGEAAQGIDPAKQRAAARTADTFGQAFSIYLEQHAKLHKRTWQEDERQYNLHLKRWDNRPLSQLARMDVELMHRRIGATAPVAANRVLALVSKFFSWAMLHGYNGSNPAKGVQRFKEVSRDRYLAGAELGRFIRALDDEPNQTMREYFLVLLLTGQRRDNVASMRFVELDFERAVWTIPPEKFKSNRAMEVPLIGQVLDILARRRDDTAPGVPWVFLGRRHSGGELGHLSEPKAAFARLLKRAGIVNLKLHDLRRTVASMATSLGVPYPVVAAMLGHVPQGVTAVYSRPTPDAIRSAFERTAAAILATKELQ